MTFRHIAIGALAGLAGLVVFAAVATRAQEPPRPDQLVDALNGVFGKHPGDRAAHTKGICLTGRFTPSPDASSLSKAPQFAKPVGIIGRFSLGGGNPQAPDNAQDNVRGLAVRQKRTLGARAWPSRVGQWCYRLRAIGGSEGFRSQPSLVYRRQYAIQSTRVSDQSRPMRSSTTRTIRMTPITPMPP